MRTALAAAFLTWASSATLAASASATLSRFDSVSTTLNPSVVIGHFGSVGSPMDASVVIADGTAVLNHWTQGPAAFGGPLVASGTMNGTSATALATSGLLSIGVDGYDPRQTLRAIADFGSPFLSPVTSTVFTALATFSATGGPFKFYAALSRKDFVEWTSPIEGGSFSVLLTATVENRSFTYTSNFIEPYFFTLQVDGVAPAVPEPATWSLLVVGLLAVSAVGRIRWTAGRRPDPQPNDSLATFASSSVSGR